MCVWVYKGVFLIEEDIKYKMYLFKMYFYSRCRRHQSYTVHFLTLSCRYKKR